MLDDIKDHLGDANDGWIAKLMAHLEEQDMRIADLEDQQRVNAAHASDEVVAKPKSKPVTHAVTHVAEDQIHVASE